MPTNTEVKSYSESEEFKSKILEMVWMNRIQTVAVIVAFIWGVRTIKDLIKKVK